MKSFKRYIKENIGHEKSIFVMRHGSTALDKMDRSDGWLDFPLSDKGRRGLVDAQQLFKEVNLRTIYVPPMKRNVETAEIIKSGSINPPEIVEVDAIKTWNLGILMGTLKAAGKPTVARLLANPDVPAPSGESVNDFRGRFMPWLKERMEEVQAGGGPILLVLSGSNLRCIGDEIGKDYTLINLGEGGVAVLNFEDAKWVIKPIIANKADENEIIS